ncbi:deoxyhypusine hydroxylase-like isoform X2 [Gordionus sp. m RMFG-2023]|uniref:deoxyhypusine hydroxylase-like isoform X2 n=1 Tax=Gordionus sp. m RMFG-2023 TaxID=3053472 RepID=UPI0031FC3D7A
MLDKEKIINDSIGILLDKNIPLTDKFRAVFTLRNIGGKKAIDSICKCIEIESSVLLKHECAYCLGQMKDSYSIPKLLEILSDEKVEIIVRHEAAEAIAAIGEESTLVINTLKKYIQHTNKELKETCYLALRRFSWLKECKEKRNSIKNPSFSYDGSIISYDTIDPTPSLQSDFSLNPDNVDPSYLLTMSERILKDPEADLYDRYKAIFTLRDIGTDDAVEIMAQVLADPKNTQSYLLKHELAFVMGQMQNPICLLPLKERLSDKTDHCMVRHECAEAIGSIIGYLNANPTSGGTSENILNFSIILQDVNNQIGEVGANQRRNIDEIVCHLHFV